MTESIPKIVEDDYSGVVGLESITAENPEKRFRSILRLVFALLLGALVLGEVALYSLHKAMESRVESQDRRFERLSALFSDLLASRSNAEKIEGIEHQVDGVLTSVNELNEIVQGQPD